MAGCTPKCPGTLNTAGECDHCSQLQGWAFVPRVVEMAALLPGPWVLGRRLGGWVSRTGGVGGHREFLLSYPSGDNVIVAPKTSFKHH